MLTVGDLKQVADLKRTGTEADLPLQCAEDTRSSRLLEI